MMHAFFRRHKGCLLVKASVETDTGHFISEIIHGIYGLLTIIRYGLNSHDNNLIVSLSTGYLGYNQALVGLCLKIQNSGNRQNVEVVPSLRLV